MSPLSLSLADIQREYLDDLRHRVTPAHYRNVEQRLGSTLAALGADQVDALQPLVVIRYRNQLRASHLSNRSANLVVDNLRTMLAWASECGLVESNPLDRIRRLPEGEKLNQPVMVVWSRLDESSGCYEIGLRYFEAHC